MSDSPKIKRESNTNYKSICCENIPPAFLDKAVAKSHFGKFGNINRFILRPNRFSCAVEYDTEDSAETAYLEAGNYNGYEFPVSFSEREVAHVQNTEEWVDPEVQSELEAMTPSRYSALPPIAQTFSNSPQKTFSPPLRRPPKQFSPVTKPAKINTDVEPVKFDAALKMEYEAILKQAAVTTEEKYRCLDTRDKLIRMLTVRQTDIKKAKTTLGTCPDMCPEKERLMRQFQRQVSIFEISRSKFDSNGDPIISHHRAIKEYSRSSADQETPLKHELRPERVLKMTMLYLLHKIMDLCNDPQISLGDWFHFVWDRTRSIRKDVTQQELCSLGSVELLQQCARFHIHCAARLVAEDSSVFDKKINVENLTKCLQTLKYMYHDLRLQNIVCPCEAEFRSYIVLLNLGDSNFLWELKHLPENIQKSAEIKQAIAFYKALERINYVQFFKLLRSPKTSYLSACILLGYFNKFRLRALDLIVKAYNWRKNNLPLNYIKNVLGFESEEEAEAFVSYNGLPVEEGRIILERLNPPVAEFFMDRAFQNVESKLKVSVGECINGGPLESVDIFENHVPHNSFDENGFLKVEAWNADDQLRGDAAKQNSMKIEKVVQDQKASEERKFVESVEFPKQNTTDTKILKNKTDANIFKMPQVSQQQKFVTPPSTSSSGFDIFKQTPAPLATSTPIFNNFTFSANNNNNNNAKNLFTNISNNAAVSGFKDTNAFVKPTTAPPAPAFNIFNASNNTPLSNNIFGDNTIKTWSQQNNVKEIEEQKRAEEQRLLEQKRKEKEQELEQLEARIKAEKQKQLELEQRKALEKQKFMRKQLLEKLELRAENLLGQLLDSFLIEQLKKIAEEEFSKYAHLQENSAILTELLIEEVIRDEVIKITMIEFQNESRLQTLQERYFHYWLKKTRRNIENRKLLANGPMWVTNRRLEQTSDCLKHPKLEESLTLIKRYRQGESCNFKELLWLPKYHDVPKTVNIFELLLHNSTEKYMIKSGLNKTRKYVKLIFALPAEFEELPGFRSTCNKWLSKHLSLPKEANKNNDISYICAVEYNVALCVRKIVGIDCLNENEKRSSDATENADGIICFTSCVNVKNTECRLANLIKRANVNKSVPLGIVVYNGLNADNQRLAKLLQLEKFITAHYLTSYRIFGCGVSKEKFDFILHFSNAIRFVALESKANNEYTQDLEMQPLHSWLETCLGAEMWVRWYTCSLNNIIFYKICTVATFVVDLFNTAVQRLLNVINVRMNCKPDFPKELKDFVPQAPTYDAPLGFEYFPPNWKDAETQLKIVKFLKKLKLPAIEENSFEDMGSATDFFLKYGCLLIPDDDIKATKASYNAIKALIEQLNRKDLKKLEIKERFRAINYIPVIEALSNAQINHLLEGTEIDYIYYLNSAIRNYQNQPWWLHFTPAQKLKVDFLLHEQDLQCKSPEMENVEENCQDMAQILKKAEEVSRKTDESILNKKENSLNNSIADTMYLLDESLEKFEQAKKLGMYDVDLHPEMKQKSQQITQTIQQENDNAQKETEITKCTDSMENKNKRKHRDDHDGANMQDTIQRAFELLQRVEEIQDRKRQMLSEFDD